MLTCTRCCLIYSGWPANRLCSVCNGELRALHKNDQNSLFNAPVDVEHCLVCNATLAHRNRNTRYCSTACTNRAKYWYTKDPNKYHRFAPAHRRPDLAARHAARRAQKEAGYLNVPRPGGMHNTELIDLNNPVEVMWLLAAADEPAIKAAGQVREATDLLTGDEAHFPPIYAAWRAKQPWAEATELSTKLDALLRDAPPPPVEAHEADSAPGVECICSLCDAHFKAPFDTDICPNCL